MLVSNAGVRRASGMMVLFTRVGERKVRALGRVSALLLEKRGRESCFFETVLS
jgi:hypothetical protein